MLPFLRPATPFGRAARPAPEGWTAEVIGTWRSRSVEVVYDPQHHRVAVVLGRSPATTAMLANDGWSRRGRDGSHEWWTRDVTDHLRSRFDAVGRAARDTGPAVAR